ncbi:MAG: Na+/H+ antiporter subunit E [Proteocatella sp.]
MNLLKGDDFIKKLLYYLQLTAIFTVFVIALYERMTSAVIVLAPALALFSIFISEKFLLKASYFELYYFNIFKIIPYCLILLFEIYKASFALIPVIISGKSHPGIVSIPTKLKKNMNIAILANSVTLTPGTITLDTIDKSLVVLWLNPKTKNSQLAGKMIKGKFEKRLKEDKS